MERVKEGILNNSQFAEHHFLFVSRKNGSAENQPSRPSFLVLVFQAQKGPRFSSSEPVARCADYRQVEVLWTLQNEYDST